MGAAVLPPGCQCLDHPIAVGSSWSAFPLDGKHFFPLSSVLLKMPVLVTFLLGITVLCPQITEEFEARKPSVHTCGYVPSSFWNSLSTTLNSALCCVSVECVPAYLF